MKRYLLLILILFVLHMGTVKLISAKVLISSVYTDILNKISALVGVFLLCFFWFLLLFLIPQIDF